MAYVLNLTDDEKRRMGNIKRMMNREKAEGFLLDAEGRVAFAESKLKELDAEDSADKIESIRQGAVDRAIKNKEKK